MHKLLERCLAWKGHKHSPQAYLIFRTCKLNRSGTLAFSQSQAGNLFPSSPPVSMEAHPRKNKDTVLFTWVQPSLFICLSYFHSTSTLESRNDADMDMFYCYISKSNQNKQTKKQKTPSQDGLLSKYLDKCISIMEKKSRFEPSPKAHTGVKVQPC